MIFKEIKEFNTIITNITKAGNSIEEIAKITNGLTKAESSLVMTEAGLSNALIERINIMNDVTAATVTNTVATQTETLSDEDWLLTQWLCIGAEETDTAATIANTAAKKSGLTIIDVLGLKYKNLAASIGISTTALTGFTVALVAIGAGIAIFNHFNETIEEVSEKVANLKDEFQSALDTAESNIKTLNSVKDKYIELSKGVNQLGENVSLTTEEYQEYNSIVNKIADMSPELIKGWTNEGNAIIDLKGNIDDLADSYNKARIAAYNLLIASGENGDGNDIIQQWKYLSNDDFWNKDIFGTNAFNETAKRDLAKLISENNNDVDDFINSLNNFLEQNNYASNEITDFLRSEIGITIGSYDTFSGFKSSWNGEKLTSKELSSIKSKANAIAKTYQAEINTALYDVKSLANAYMMVDDIYSSFDDSTKNIVSVIVNSIDEEIANTFNNQADVGEYVVNILESLRDATPEVNDALVKLFEINYEDLPVSETKPLIDKYISIISKALGEDPVEFKIRLGFESYDKIYDNYQQILNYAAKKASGATDNEIVNSRGKYAEYQEIYDKIDNFAINYSINTQDQIAAFQDALDKAKYDIDKAFEYYLKQNDKENQTDVSSIVDSVKQIATQLEPQFTKLGEAYKEIFTSDGFTLDNVDNSMLEGLRTTFAEIEKEIGVTFDSSQLESFFDALTDKSGTSVEQSKRVQQAFNDIATSYFYSTDTLNNLNETTAASIQKQLEELNVANAKEVVYDTLKMKTEALALQEEFLADNKEDLVKASSDKVLAFLEQAGASETARQYLFLLIAQEQAFNVSDLSTKGKIEKLKELADAYGQTAIAARIANIEETARNNREQPHWDKELSDLQEELNKSITQIELNIKGIDNAGSNAADAYLEAFEKELKALQDLRDRGVIDESTYLDRLRELYIRYFADREEYLEEFNKYEREYLEGMESLYNSALSAVIKLKDEKLDAIEEEKDKTLDALEEEKDARLDVIDAQKEQLEAQLDLIDKQIESKENIIDGIQDEIDAMQEANDERKRAIDLQKAQYELERMQNQRVNLIYKDGQMIYENDESGIRDARESVSDAQLEIEIADKEKKIALIEKEIELFEKQKDAINEQIDALDKQSESIEKYYSTLIEQQEKFYDSMIESIETEKSKWEELAEIKEVADAYSAIEQVFGGLGYTVDDVLNNSAGAFEDFKSKYIGLLDVMNSNDSFGEGLGYAVAELDKSLSEVGTSTEGLDALPEKMDGITSSVSVTADAFNGDKESLGSAIQTVIDKVAGSSEDKKDKKSKESEADTSSLVGAIQSQYDKTSEVVPQQIEIFTAFKEIISSCVTELNNMITSMEKLSTLSVNGIGTTPVTPYATGTKHAKKGLSIVAEESPELIEDTKGNLSLVTEPTLMNMKGGEIVYNGDKTKALLKPLDESNPSYAMFMETKSLLNSEKFYPSNTLSRQVDGMMDSIKSVQPASNANQNVNLSIGDIQLHGVQDVNGLANAISTKLPNMLLQTITKR